MSLMLWLKTGHLISMVAWFAGLFYLPRLFVYHADPTLSATSYQRFCTMEYRLCYAIMLPAGILCLGFGGAMLYTYAWALYGTDMWLHAKLGLVALLVLYHGACIAMVHQFRRGHAARTARYYRIWNEFPTVILIGTIILAVFKPHRF